VVSLSFLLLMIVFRSILVPLKAAMLNLLSIGAAYGVVVAVFQWGWGRSLIGLDEAVPIASFVPMMMFAILFGLSMDYEVFILSRIREEYHRRSQQHRQRRRGPRRHRQGHHRRRADHDQRLPRIRRQRRPGGEDDGRRARHRRRRRRHHRAQVAHDRPPRDRHPATMHGARRRPNWWLGANPRNFGGNSGELRANQQFQPIALLVEVSLGGHVGPAHRRKQFHHGDRSFLAYGREP
jgi:hypothetical protein